MSGTKRCYRAGVTARLALENLENRQLMAADLTPLAGVEAAITAEKIVEPASANPAGFLGGHDPVVSRGKPISVVATRGPSLSPAVALRIDIFDGMVPEPGIDGTRHVNGEAPLPCGVVEEPTRGDVRALNAIDNDREMQQPGLQSAIVEIGARTLPSSQDRLIKVVPLSNPLRGTQPAAQAAVANPRLAVPRTAIVDNVFAVAEAEGRF